MRYLLRLNVDKTKQNEVQKKKRRRVDYPKKYIVLTATHEYLPLNMEFWYIGSGCNRTCRVANMKANVAKIHASMQPEMKTNIIIL